jgi:LemA protein
LQSEIEGTENRINVERNKFNEVVKEHNSTVRSFPANVSAKLFGFSQKAYFEAAPGSEVAPKVDFTKEKTK